MSESGPRADHNPAASRGVPIAPPVSAPADLADAARLYLHLIDHQARAQLQYRASFLLQVAGVFCGGFVDFLAILILFGRFESIGGWTVAEVALLYGLVAVPFAIAHLVGQGFDEFAMTIRTGSFDQVLIRPRTTFLQVLGSQFSLRQLGRVAEALVVLGLGLAWLDVRAWWSVGHWLFMLWSIAGGVLFFLGMMLVGATLCFWTVESIEAINIFTYGGAEMAHYPMHIFGDWLRRVFIYLVPLAFVNYVPALWLLGKPDPLGLPAWAPLLAVPLCAVVFGVGLLAWRTGVRHYLSTGS